MNEHIMESLLLDQSLDALSPDVGHLLRAYLSDHPEFQHLSDAIHQTAALGQKAVAVEMPTEMPAFPGERLVQQSHPVRWQPIRAWKAIAACILIGMGIGFSFKPSLHRDPEAGPTTIVTQAHAEVKPLSGSREVTRAFWSAKTYQALYENNRTRTKTYQSVYEEYRKGGHL